MHGLSQLSVGRLGAGRGPQEIKNLIAGQAMTGRDQEEEEERSRRSARPCPLRDGGLANDELNWAKEVGLERKRGGRVMCLHDQTSVSFPRQRSGNLCADHGDILVITSIVQPYAAGVN